MPPPFPGTCGFAVAASSRPVAPGLWILLPGVPQWAWRQRERGLLLGGSFVASAGVGLFAWGTWTGVALLAFAYLTHVMSASDAIRQWAFPGFGPWLPTVSASAGLAVGCYAPMILLGSLVAWPGLRGGPAQEGYLVNRWSYLGADPEPGAHVWLGGDHRGAGHRVAEMLATPGEDVEWDGHSLRLNGRRVSLVPFPPGQSPRGLAFKVPADRFLIAFQPDDAAGSRAWELVPKGRVEGRAWAQLYPVWSRRLLP